MIKTLTKKECIEILSENYIGHLGYIFQNRPFVIPITYYFNSKDNMIICYSGEGHKTIAMRRNDEVALQVNEIDTVNRWKSVLIHGKFQQLFGSDAKAQLHSFSLGIKDIILNREFRDVDFISEFSSKIAAYEDQVIFKINVEEITGKKRLRF
ncbi:MAG: pyridoxamine 5'-phosphate oxidase family protein [Flavobacteriaceae bacterium]|nr:pyridoxamine 5'-phosphate oxidase family protein [Flavobacteriaceae bacterium]